MNTESLLFAMLRSEVCGEEILQETESFLDSDTLQELYVLSKRHDMTHIVTQAIRKLNVDTDNEVIKSFEKQQMLAIFRYQKIQYELERLCGALEEAKIKYIPLKGSVIRNYYPEPWLRTSCDIDIFVESKDLSDAVEYIVEKLNYKKGNKNLHDYSLFSESGVHLELHYDLIEEMRHPAFANILSGIWEHAHLKEGFEYQYLLNDDFFYYYHIAHMVKHFEEGGCGIRPFLDLWILNHRLTYESSSREEILRLGNLSVFAKTADKLSEVWFSCAEHDDITLQMEKYILFGGVYGNLENKVSLQQQKKGGRLQYVFLKIFPRYSVLKLQFPVLKKHPYLYPVFVVYRWFSWLFKDNAKNTIRELSLNNTVSKDKVDEVADLYSKLGL